VLAVLITLLLVLGMFLDGISIMLIVVPLVLPLMQHFQWDVVWFGVVLVLTIAIGQFTPPMAVNLMVAAKIAQVRMEATTRWVLWLVLAMCLAMLAVVVWPSIALWLPQRLGY
jgi:TRAP-type C4-dicarboxylate transport system permease large subunit